MPIATGTTLNQYEIVSLLGKGGMGEVYRARDLKLKRDVAIKILPDEFAAAADRISRFQREAETLAVVNHATSCVDSEPNPMSGRTIFCLMDGSLPSVRLMQYPGRPAQLLKSRLC